MENLDFAEQFQIFDLFSGESKISSVALLGLHSGAGAFHESRGDCCYLYQAQAFPRLLCGHV